MMSYSSDESDTDDEFRSNLPFGEEVLFWINKIRERHGSPPVQYSYDLEGRANAAALQLVAGETTDWEEDTGECASVVEEDGSGEMTGHQVVEMWYADQDNYDFDNHCYTRGGADVGQFGQMVWSSTNEFGIARVTSNGNEYIVAKFWPAGCGPHQSFSENISDVVNPEVGLHKR